MAYKLSNARYYVRMKETTANRTADVQPVRYGRWECVGHDDTTYWYRCSVCGHE